MQPAIPLSWTDPTYPGMRHGMEPIRAYEPQQEVADQKEPLPRMPYQQKYDAAIRGLLNTGQPRPLSY